MSDERAYPADWFEIDDRWCLNATLEEAAVIYTRMGWPVFPLRPGGKAPALPSAHSGQSGVKCRGECGRDGHGFYDATVRLRTVLRWWRDNPNYGIGLRTGVAFDVLDMDGCTYAEGKAELPAVDNGIGPSVLTPHGSHHYYEPTGLGRHIRFTPHNDFLGGTEGYVVAPPTPGYRWFAPHGLPLRPMPIVLREFILSRPGAASSSTAFASDLIPHFEHRRSDPGPGLVRTVATAPVGTRNNVLNWAAFRLGRHVSYRVVDEASAQRIADEMLAAAESAGLSRSEAVRTFESGFRAGVA